MSKNISNERKALFYWGTGLMVLGALLFFSVFVTFALNFSDLSQMDEQMRSGALRAVGGMALLLVGAALRRVGARGMAGSGMVLDPKRAREDLEPYSRMAGGLVRDVLEEAEVLPKGDARGDANGDAA